MRSKTPKRFRSNDITAHFRFLGLKRGECRTHVIRSAAQSMSSMLTGSEDHFHTGTADRRRAQIAFATYRLLDPRERAAIYERVQLAYPLDRDDDDEVPVMGTLELAKPVAAPAKAKAATPNTTSPKPSTNSVVKLMNQKVIEEAITEEVAPSEYSAVICEQNIESDESIMEERRSIVRELREAEEASLRGLSPLGWLRSRLGI